MGYTLYRRNDFYPQRQEIKVGIILESLDEETGTYKRIGMFAHPLPNIIPHDRVVPMPWECKEFVSFDLTNYECHTVKIV